MQMFYSLLSVFAGVDHATVTAGFESELFGQFRGCDEKLARDECVCVIPIEDIVDFIPGKK